MSNSSELEPALAPKDPTTEAAAKEEEKQRVFKHEIEGEGAVESTAETGTSTGTDVCDAGDDLLHVGEVEMSEEDDADAGVPIPAIPAAVAGCKDEGLPVPASPGAATDEDPNKTPQLQPPPNVKPLPCPIISLHPENNDTSNDKGAEGQLGEPEQLEQEPQKAQQDGGNRRCSSIGHQEFPERQEQVNVAEERFAAAAAAASSLPISDQVSVPAEKDSTDSESAYKPTNGCEVANAETPTILTTQSDPDAAALTALALAATDEPSTRVPEEPPVDPEVAEAILQDQKEAEFLESGAKTSAKDTDNNSNERDRRRYWDLERDNVRRRRRDERQRVSQHGQTEVRAEAEAPSAVHDEEGIEHQRYQITYGRGSGSTDLLRRRKSIDLPVLDRDATCFPAHEQDFQFVTRNRPLTPSEVAGPRDRPIASAPVLLLHSQPLPTRPTLVQSSRSTAKMATSATFRLNDGVDELYHPQIGENPPSAEECMLIDRHQQEADESANREEPSPPISDVDYRPTESPGVPPAPNAIPINHYSNPSYELRPSRSRSSHRYQDTHLHPNYQNPVHSDHSDQLAPAPSPTLQLTKEDALVPRQRDPAFSPVPWPEQSHRFSRAPSVIPPRDVYGYEGGSASYPTPPQVPPAPSKKHKHRDRSPSRREGKRSESNNLKSKDRHRDKEKSRTKHSDKSRSNREKQKDKERGKDQPQKSEGKGKDRMDKSKERKHKHRRGNGITEGNANAAPTTSAPTQTRREHIRSKEKENIPVTATAPAPIPAPPAPAPVPAPPPPTQGPPLSRRQKFFTKLPRLPSKSQKAAPPPPLQPSQPPPPQPQSVLRPPPPQPVRQNKSDRHRQHQPDASLQHHSTHRHRDSRKNDDRKVKVRTPEEEQRRAEKKKERTKETKDKERHKHRDKNRDKNRDRDGERKVDQNDKHKNHKEKSSKDKDQSGRGADGINDSKDKEERKLKKKSKSEGKERDRDKDKPRTRDKNREKSESSSKRRDDERDKKNDKEHKDKSRKHHRKDRDKNETEEERRQRREARRQKREDKYVKDGTATTAANVLPTLVVQDSNDGRPGPPVPLEYLATPLAEERGPIHQEAHAPVELPAPSELSAHLQEVEENADDKHHVHSDISGREHTQAEEGLPNEIVPTAEGIPIADLPPKDSIPTSENTPIEQGILSFDAPPAGHSPFAEELPSGESIQAEGSIPLAEYAPNAEGILPIGNTQFIENDLIGEGASRTENIPTAEDGQLAENAPNGENAETGDTSLDAPLRQENAPLTGNTIPTEYQLQEAATLDAVWQRQERFPGAFEEPTMVPQSVPVPVSGSHLSFNPEDAAGATSMQQGAAEADDSVLASTTTPKPLEPLTVPISSPLIIPPIASPFIEYQASFPEVVPSDEKILVTEDELGHGEPSTISGKRRSKSRRNQDSVSETKEERRRRRAAEKAAMNNIPLPSRPPPIVAPEQAEEARRRKANKATELPTLAPTSIVPQGDAQAARKRTKEHRSEEEKRLRREQRKLERTGVKNQQAETIVPSDPPTLERYPHPRYDNRPAQPIPNHWAGATPGRGNGGVGMTAYQETYRSQMPMGLHGPPEPGLGHYGYGIGNGTPSGSQVMRDSTRNKPKHKKSVTIDEVVRDDRPGVGKEQGRQKGREKDRQKREKERERERERMAEAAGNWVGNQSEVNQSTQQKTGGRFGGGRFGNFFLRRSFSKLFGGGRKEKGPSN